MCLLHIVSDPAHGASIGNLQFVEDIRRPVRCCCVLRYHLTNPSFFQTYAGAPALRMVFSLLMSCLQYDPDVIMNRWNDLKASVGIEQLGICLAIGPSVPPAF